MRFAAIFCILCVGAFAETWRGALVDADCYSSVTHNINPHDTEMYVNRDKEWDIRRCAPRAKTSSFTMVPLNGMEPFRLDPSGNARAAELVRKAGGAKFVTVDVIGTPMPKKTVRVDSISLAK
jgi:hypothetical protein